MFCSYVIFKLQQEVWKLYDISDKRTWWQKIELGSYLFGQICNYNYSYQDLVRCSSPCFVLLNPFSHEMTSKVPKKKKKWRFFLFSNTPFCFWYKFKEKLWILYFSKYGLCTNLQSRLSNLDVNSLRCVDFPLVAILNAIEHWL